VLVLSTVVSDVVLPAQTASWRASCLHR